MSSLHSDPYSLLVGATRRFLQGIFIGVRREWGRMQESQDLRARVEEEYRGLGAKGKKRTVIHKKGGQAGAGEEDALTALS